MLRIKVQEIDELEREFQGIANEIFTYDSADLPSCPNCVSPSVAAVRVGSSPRLIAISSATNKFHLAENRPEVRPFYCRVCGQYFSRP